MGWEKGFTLVEVIVVIVVIVILVTIAAFGINKFQADGRDAQRTVDATTIADSLEKYYDHNSEYPSCAQLTAPASTVRSQSGALAGIDSDALIAPKAGVARLTLLAAPTWPRLLAAITSPMLATVVTHVILSRVCNLPSSISMKAMVLLKPSAASAR